jgi:hypothetical protein
MFQKGISDNQLNPIKIKIALKIFTISLLLLFMEWNNRYGSTGDRTKHLLTWKIELIDQIGNNAFLATRQYV